MKEGEGGSDGERECEALNPFTLHDDLKTTKLRSGKFHVVM